ncbi:MAG: lycopene cyclase domain-containing protein [Flavobacteriales bacterium]
MFGLHDTYTYLLLNILSIAYPIAQSFEHRITMWKKWHAILPAILITGSIFIAWDELFTRLGVWSFNEQYLTGIFIASLPLEEWLFFLTVPYACIFIYLVLNYFIKKDLLKNVSAYISYGLGSALILVGLLSLPRLYTSTACIGAGGLMIFLQGWIKAPWLSRYYLAYLVTMIPFIIVNGQLTVKPVVIYDNAQNSGIRIHISNWANIPVEDMAYNMFMLILAIGLYEHFMNRREQRTLSTVSK